MKEFFKNYSLPKYTEIVCMLTLGIVLQMTDGSPFTLKKGLTIVWETDLPSEYFSPVDAAPGIMLIWLLISAVKSIGMTFFEALTGVYVCSAFGSIRNDCIEFFLSKSVEIIFATYLWVSVLYVYQDMRRIRENQKKPESWDEFFNQIGFRRPRTRSLMDESILKKTACLNNFEFRDVPQIILQMLRREEDMSRDSLLGPGMMLASVSNFGSFDDLKTSHSLGELGLFDLKSVEVMEIDDRELLKPSEKALKFLKMNWDDVENTVKNRQPLNKNIFKIDDNTWKDLGANDTSVNKPKTGRPEIFLKDLTNLNASIENSLLREEKKRKTLTLKFGFSLFSFLREKEELKIKEEEQLSYISNTDDDEDEEDGEDYNMAMPLFMSNIKEEVPVNRIHLDFVSRKIKGNTYAKLYKEDYMSVIGPEVYERATKLPKLNSPIYSKLLTKSSTSLPNITDKKKLSQTIKNSFDSNMESHSIFGSINSNKMNNDNLVNVALDKSSNSKISYDSDERLLESSVPDDLCSFYT
ncbi:hypothetical protein Phum_PHUM430240 [Pediculus humanus corporis]|uniref:Uncharacterized protein n=1 Tax=Pediculus humanus subsp. corporis TaxID=121224 RepID=E0VTB4_PEDHC|nr:uncharacterized protein Phum_PHUM430240 [Pediculus humanus corporis]EEB16620.1 hypothetical protein Phum_PHUM430240 [Pediculus humanus corporis]